MRTLVSGTLTVQAYDAKAWKQERNVLRVTDPDATEIALCFPTAADEIARYMVDENSSVEIDVSDLIRVYSEGAHDLFVVSDSSNTVNANYEVVGLVSPVAMLKPSTELSNFALVPPKRMLASIVSGVLLLQTVQTEYYKISPTADRYSIRLHKADGTTTSITLLSNTPKAFEIPADVVSYDVYFGLMRLVQRTGVIVPLECGRTYAAVRWVSATGQTRVHTFEVVKRKSETDGAYELATVDGSYNEVKGRKDGFSIRLDGLTVYDLWYYMDVCHSSSVEVSFDGVSWRRVQVVTRGVTLPDGDAGKMNVFEAELNYIQYDAVSM